MFDRIPFVDVDANPCRPAYSMADYLPLNLFHCNFDDINWEYDQVHKHCFYEKHKRGKSDLR